MVYPKIVIEAMVHPDPDASGGDPGRLAGAKKQTNFGVFIRVNNRRS